MIIAIQQIINHKNQINTVNTNEVFMSPIFVIEITVVLGDGYTSIDPTI